MAYDDQLLAFSLLGAALAPAFAVTTASELTHKDAYSVEIQYHVL